MNETVLVQQHNQPSTYRWAPGNRGRLWIDGTEAVEYRPGDPAADERNYVHTGVPQGWSASAYFRTAVERDAFLALWPKGAGITGGRLWTTDTEEVDDGVLYTAIAQGNLWANGVNGGVNETGIKRYRTIIRAAEKSDLPIGWTGQYGNAFPSRAAFEEALTERNG